MKKTFYQNSAVFWFGLFLEILGICSMIGLIVFGFMWAYGEYSIISIIIGFVVLICFICLLYAYLYNRVIFYEDRIFITGHKDNKKARVQFEEKIMFSEIETVNRLCSNKNSKKRTRNSNTTNDLRPYAYFEFVLKNGKTKWLCITYFSRKQRREMISIINEKTGLNLNYDKMVEEDLSYFARKKKSKEQTKKEA